ncbi:MAG: glycoside hydrolase family 30 beta sandwich domain-containing protein, partial [bacterium]
DPILKDSAACANTDIICGHIYGGGLAAYPLAESKGKEVWMTEHLSGENSNSNNWTWAINVALEMNNVMNAGMNAYIWWYLVRYYGPICDGTNDCGIQGEITKKGFVMSQFSKFIRPGFYRIECPSHAQSNIFLSAYKNSTSEVVVVIINNGSTPKYQTVTLYNGDVNLVTPFTTSKKKNCEQGEDIFVREGKFTVLVEPSSITTFVSN